MTNYGLTNCKTCDREFETSFTTDTEVIEGYPRSEDWPDKEECDFCEGTMDCSEDGCTAQATVLDTDMQVVFCEAHWNALCKENGDTVEECEDFILRLDKHLHAKPKEDK